MKAVFSSQKYTMFPNILLIVMDATRAKNLSCYGYNRPTTPHLAQFAEHSVVYKLAISPGGWSLPSHASIFTGLFPSRHGAHDQHKFLSSDLPTMAELLSGYGYHTAAFCSNPYVGPATGLDRGFEEFNDAESLPRPLTNLGRKMDAGAATVLGWRDSGARYTNRQVRPALRRLGEAERPFFLFVHYGEPHALYRPPRKYNRYLPTGVSPREARAVNQDQWNYLANPASMNHRDFEILTALYDGEITYLDSRIAQVLGWLHEFQLLDRTMVIVTADHGENVGDHQLMAHKYCLYDTLVHVPLIIRYPQGTIAPGQVTHQVQTLDLLPTVLAMLGDTSSELVSSLQGHDLLSSSRHEFTIAEQARPDLSTFHRRFPGMDISRYDRALKMIRTERYKFIWASDSKHELYDILLDPDETHNIVNQRPEIAQDLHQRLTEWRNSSEAAAPSGKTPEFDDETKARLRALGYLE
jgi:arylsulfatase A-like enzyme